MYANARSLDRVGKGFSQEFEVKVGIHQGSILSPSSSFCWRPCHVSFGLVFPGRTYMQIGLVFIADSQEDCVRSLLIWKEAMEKKRLSVNAGKTKVMIYGTGLDLLQSSGEYPCAVSRTGVGNNSIHCNGCKLWLHKKCSGGTTTDTKSQLCALCMGNAPLPLLTTDHRVKIRSDLISWRW